MLLSEVFLPEFMNCDLKGCTKDEVFEEMVDQFCLISKKNIKKEVIAALQEREARMSTGVQHGIAIPHGKTAVIDGVFGILGVSKQGVDYGSLDGKRVHLILMILAPPVEAGTHLHILQQMANFLRKPSFYTDVVNAKDGETVYAFLKSYEDLELDAGKSSRPST
ncbi:MAG: PTS sugar transporter subunit IIA [Spirochaetaceae bacterium]|jgi:PTS system fructose-specific IIC component/PTS system nitrogen regulatory IIA component|nr:PTS sugar transporter subunit IIA [Spirochaetaceae bacterium]